VQRVFERGQGAVRPLLRGQKFLLDERTRRGVEIAQVLLVVLETVIFALFEDVDGGLFAQSSSAPLGGLGERFLRSRSFRRLAPELDDAHPQKIDALLV